MAEREKSERLGGAASLLGAGSARGNIPSFIVMDVMRAAQAQEAAGYSIIHMEVGQPGTPAPQAARLAASARARELDARLYHGAGRGGAACTHR